MFLFLTILTLTAQAQFDPKDWKPADYPTKEETQQSLDRMKVEKRIMDMNTISGYAEYLSLQAKHYIDSLGIHHGTFPLAQKTIDWLVESHPETITGKGSPVRVLTVTRPGTKPWIYTIYSTLSGVQVYYESYGFANSRFFFSGVLE